MGVPPPYKGGVVKWVFHHHIREELKVVGSNLPTFFGDFMLELVRIDENYVKF